jgi:hypothetical protein
MGMKEKQEASRRVNIMTVFSGLCQKFDWAAVSKLANVSRNGALTPSFQLASNLQSVYRARTQPVPSKLRLECLVPAFRFVILCS